MSDTSNPNMIFQEEVKALCDISVMLLQRLEPKPVLKSESDYVKEYIKKVCQEIKEKGWFEQEGDKPWIETFEQEKYILRIAFIHARKGEHITGADLVFELKDEKVIFVQSKRVGSNGRIHFNRFQLQKLIELEGQICGLFPFYSDINIIYHRVVKYYGHKYFPFALFLPFSPPCYLPFRAVFYHLIMTNQQQIEERFFHISEISFTLAGNKSISQKEFLNHGLKPNEFQEMFWECKIGGPDIGEDIKRVILHFFSLLTNRLIIWLEIEERSNVLPK